MELKNSDDRSMYKDIMKPTEKYGYFDIDNKEYVITRPDTPTPWINYLGFGGFGSFISNNGGGLLFDGDPGKRRLTRYRYNTLPVDRQGRYIYIKDMESGEYYSPTWQPVIKDLDFYECRHGLSYTTIRGEYSGIKSELTVYIPVDKNYEVWSCKLKNISDKTKNLKLFPYIEFSHHDGHIDNMMEWARYFMTCTCENKTIVFDSAPEFNNCGPLFGFMSTTLDIDGYDCHRDSFIGAFRSEQNPIAVEKGNCSDTQINADQACGAFSCPLALNTGEEKHFLVIVGATKDPNTISKTVEEALNIDNVDKDLHNIKSKWDALLENCQINTPDEDVNKMINIWHAYQCHTTFNWSRFVSFYERGSDRGWGFRDSMQDVLGIMHAMPEKAKERIKTLLKIQCSNGNAKAVLYPATGETKGGDRSDDHLWSVYSVCAYIKETGDYAFLDEVLPYHDGGDGTVLEHLLKGLEFTKNHTGVHDIPLFLLNDWNDSLAAIGKGGKAESAFVFFQAATAAYQLKELLDHIGKDSSYVTEYYAWCEENYKQLWDGKWFIRAFTDEGEKYGTDEDELNKIFLNPQSWAVLSHLPTEEEAQSAFDNVNRYLMCDLGYISHYPASAGYDRANKKFFPLHSGIKENGGVFCHASTWAVIAQAMIRRNDDAFKAYKATLPCRRNDISQNTLIEPYVYASAMLGPSHERYGAGSNSWLTGTASWMYYAVTQYILGFRAEYDGILIDPCIPSDWDGFQMTRIYRGKKCNLTVKGSKGKINQLNVNGNVINGNYIPYSLIKDMDTVEIIASYTE